MTGKRSEKGFTIVEVVVAMVILSIGLLGLAMSAAAVTRMVGQGQRFTRTSGYANQRFEILRAQTCAAMTGGSATQGKYSESWTVTSVSGGRGRQVTVTVVSPTGRGTRSDVFTTTIPC